MFRSFIVALALAVSSAAMAGPFGLSEGQSHQGLDVGQEGDNGVRAIRSVPNPHPDILGYAGRFGSGAGLCRIMAYTKDFTNDRYGNAVRDAYQKLKSQLESVYGNAGENDFLRYGALWDGANEWVMAVRQNERVLQAYWDASSNAQLKDGIVEILLSVRASSSDVSDVHLQYTFSNFTKCETEREDAGVGAL